MFDLSAPALAWRRVCIIYNEKKEENFKISGANKNEKTKNIGYIYI
jgi:hypothetical protein